MGLHLAHPVNMTSGLLDFKLNDVFFYIYCLL
jgi:hypothetical protein